MSSKNREAVIVAYGRSAVSRAKDGPFVGVHPIEWGAKTLEGVLDKVPQLPREDVDDVLVGCARTVNKCAKNVARLLCLRAGMTPVSAQTINRFCASGLQTMATATAAIEAGWMDVAVAGGIECMSMDQALIDGYQDPILDEMCAGAYMDMGITAENVAEQYDVSRTQMDEFAVASHKKAAAAQEAGYLNQSIIPISLEKEEGTIVFDKDQGIRASSNVEKLATLRTVFKEDGRVTAGNSSQTNDAAAFMVIMSREKAEELSLQPIARLISFATAGCAPETMGMGPIYAVPKALKCANLTVDNMDVIELNEAFAAQSLPVCKELGFPMEKVNPWGGAIALGHPMGATGTILSMKALDYLRMNGGKYALITMCIGGGQGAAGILELCE